MTLTAHVRIASRGVDVEISVQEGVTLALLGPNGSGKSTVLEAIAGLLAIDQGRVVHGEEILVDSDRGIAVHPRDRRVALVTQADTLFPTMKVLDNVAFGPRARGEHREHAERRAREWLERVDAAHLADRRPAELSGGEARRVAIARALATEPRLVLLDEPFAGLDLESATAIRALIATALTGVTAIISTHAALDAHALATHITVLDSGRAAESGPVTRVLTKPRTRFAARMAGRVLLSGSPEHHGIRLDTGELVECETEAVAQGAAAAVAIHPRDVALEPEGLRDVVMSLEPHGDMVRIHGKRLAADVDPLAMPLPQPGQSVHFAVTKASSAYSL